MCSLVIRNNTAQTESAIWLSQLSILLLVPCFPSAAHINKRSGIFVLTPGFNTCCASYSGALTRENNHENRTSICNTSATVQLTNRQRKRRLKLKSNSCHSRYTSNDSGGRGGSKCEETTHITLKRTSANWLDKRPLTSDEFANMGLAKVLSYLWLRCTGTDVWALSLKKKKKKKNPILINVNDFFCTLQIIHIKL